MSKFGSCPIDGAEGKEFVKHNLGVFYAVIGGVEGTGSLFSCFAPIFLKVSGGGLVVVIVDEVGKNCMKGFGFVSEGDVRAAALAVASYAVGEEHDGNEVRKEGLYIGVLKELGDFCGEGEGEVFGSAAEELGVAEGARWLVVAAKDVLDGVLGCIVSFVFGELGAAFVFAVILADDVEFGVDGEFALISGFNAGLGKLALSKDGAGLAFCRDIGVGCSHSLSSACGGWCRRSGDMCLIQVMAS